MLHFTNVLICTIDEWKETLYNRSYFLPVLESYCSYNFSYCFAELSPVCAIVGGVIGQEIIKVCLL